MCSVRKKSMINSKRERICRWWRLILCKWNNRHTIKRTYILYIRNTCKLPILFTSLLFTVQYIWLYLSFLFSYTDNFYDLMLEYLEIALGAANCINPHSFTNSNYWKGNMKDFFGCTMHPPSIDRLDHFIECFVKFSWWTQLLFGT